MKYFLLILCICTVSFLSACSLTKSTDAFKEGFNNKVEDTKDAAEKKKEELIKKGKEKVNEKIDDAFEGVKDKISDEIDDIKEDTKLDTE